MNSYTKFLFALIFFLCPIFSFAQDPYEKVFDLAKKLETSGSCSEAATEYKRYLFMQDYAAAAGKEGSHQIEALSFLTNYYSDCGQFPLAIDYNKQAINYSQNLQNTSEDVKLALHKKNILLQQKAAESQNFNLLYNTDIAAYISFPEFSEEIKLAANLACLHSYVYTHKWTMVKELTSQINSDYPDAISQEQLNQIFEELTALNQFKLKDPELAFYLSIIPGFGQLYSGNYKDALNAFLLDGSLLALSGYSLATLNFFDFFLLEMDATVRFYRGNMQNAQIEAIEYNNAKIKIHKDKLLNIIEEIQKN